MYLFDFTLKNFEKNLEFNQTTSWFYLTDGSFNISLNGKRLLSYNPNIFNDLNDDEKSQIEQYFKSNQLPMYEPDYYISRLYEDVLNDVLPYTWHNVNDLMHECLLNPKVYDLHWEIWHDKPYNKMIFEKCVLDTGHFGSGYMAMPTLRAWRYNDEIYIYWHGEDNMLEHIGEAIFVIKNADDFINEIYSFHNRLIAAMNKIIKRLQNSNITPEKERQLLSEQEIRCKSLEKSLWYKHIPNENFEQDNLDNGINIRQILSENPYSIDIIPVTYF